MLVICGGQPLVTAKQPLAIKRNLQPALCNLRYADYTSRSWVFQVVFGLFWGVPSFSSNDWRNQPFENYCDLEGTGGAPKGIYPKIMQRTKK